MKVVWSESDKFAAGGGGTENHTLERARELVCRGYSVEMIFLSKEHYDPGFDDIPYSFIAEPEALSSIDDTIIYIARGQNVDTIRPSFVFLHFEINMGTPKLNDYFERTLQRSRLITNSKFSQRYWANRLKVPLNGVAVVYPFAHPVFGQVERRRKSKVCRVLYPNRITPEKGLFVFLEAASYLSKNKKFEFVVLGAGNQTEGGQYNEAWLKAIPFIKYIKPAISREAMAEHYASADIVVVPSLNDIWQEPFGMTSVEGQHSGCRVIASDSGGLAETDCGLLNLIEAGNALKLKQKIEEVADLAAPTTSQRQSAITHFTLAQNVDAFLAVISSPTIL